jgi:ribosomal protein S10
MGVNSKIYAMKTFNVTITSRNKNSIYNFFLFFNKTTLCNLNARIKYLQKSVQKKRLTVLKSPHVNKKAQEQFEYRLFKKQFEIQTTKNFRYLVFLKKLNYHLFPDVHVKLKFATRNRSILKLGLRTFDPNYGKFHKFYSFKMTFFRQKSLRVIRKKTSLFRFLLSLKGIRLLKLLDLYGECFKGLFE